MDDQNGDQSLRESVPYLSADTLERLLDCRIWQKTLETYSHTTKLAVALSDEEGCLIGKCISPLPTWTLLHEIENDISGSCPFSLQPFESCSCVNDTLSSGTLIFSRSRTGLVHFALPLMLDSTRIGAVVAGQVFDQYPEQQQLELAALKLGVSPETVWAAARLEVPIKRSTLKIYAELLATLSNTFLSTTYHSITEANRLWEMTQLRAEAEDANRMKDEFLAVLSHELRTPLNAVIGWVELLRSRKLDDQTSMHGLEVIAAGARAQAKLVNDLLDTARIVSGKMQLDIQKIELMPIIGAAIASLRPAAEAKAIALRTTGDPRAGGGMGDPDRLKQIFTNLISNAINFTPRNGSVEVHLKQTESQVQVTVTDTGPGIDEGFLPFIFERFRQADSTTRRIQGGLGLGLAIAHHLVEMHGGTLLAANRDDGQGACFTLFLPFTSDRAEHVKERSIQPAPSNALLNGVRVMIVDDDAITREMFSLTLENHGAEVRTCGSVQEAMKALIQSKPDIIVSDIGMPGEDGYDLMRRLMALDDDYKLIPAIALTGYAGTEDIRKMLEVGYNLHLSKPVDPDDLCAKVLALTHHSSIP